MISSQLDSVMTSLVYFATWSLHKRFCTHETGIKELTKERRLKASANGYEFKTLDVEK